MRKEFEQVFHFKQVFPTQEFAEPEGSREYRRGSGTNIRVSIQVLWGLGWRSV